METATGAGVAKLILAWAAPVVLLAVVSIRFYQVRRRRSRSRRPSATARSPAIRRRDKAITDPARMDSILASANVCRIGFAVGDEPYVVPLSFGMVGTVSSEMATAPDALRFVGSGASTIRLYFHAASVGRKLDMLRSNPRVCVEIEGRSKVKPGTEACDWSMFYESIIGYGQLSMISDESEKRLGLAAIMAQYGGERNSEFPDSMIERTEVIRLDLTELSGKSNWPEDET